MSVPLNVASAPAQVHLMHERASQPRQASTRAFATACGVLASCMCAACAAGAVMWAVKPPAESLGDLTSTGYAATLFICSGFFGLVSLAVWSRHQETTQPRTPRPIQVITAENTVSPTAVEPPAPVVTYSADLGPDLRRFSEGGGGNLGVGIPELPPSGPESSSNSNMVVVVHP